MYTGSFTYWVNHAGLRSGVHSHKETKFALVQATSKQDARMVVFEIFLAKVSYEVLLEARQAVSQARQRETSQTQ